MTLGPITGESLAETAYRRISEAMLAGYLAPGSRLVMDTLAAELAISRTPVRDALHRLQREGLIEPAGRRGFLVRSLGSDEVLHLYEARKAVEVFAAERAAEVGRTAVDRVAEAIAAAEVMDLSRPAEAFAANRLVHREVVAATGNTLLVDLFDGVWTRARALQVYSSYFQHELVHLAVRELHEPLLDALAAGPAAAGEFMRRHIDEGLAATLHDGDTRADEG